MGNTNTASQQNDKNNSGSIILQNDMRKKMDRLAFKNIAKYSPESRADFLQYSPSSSGSLTTSRRTIQQQDDRKVSTTQQVFLDNVILPLGNEINRHNFVKKSQNKISKKACTSKESTKIVASKAHSQHYRVPAGTSQNLNPNIAALIAGNDGKDDSKEYPVVFEYNGAAQQVFLAGSFNNWQKLEMAKTQKPNDFLTVLELKQGKVQMHVIIIFLYMINVRNVSIMPFSLHSKTSNY